MTNNEFSSREQQLMAVAWQCFDGEPKVNYQRLAELTGMTNTGSAYNAWTKIRKKLAAQAKTVTPKSTPRPMKKRNSGNTAAGKGRKSKKQKLDDEYDSLAEELQDEIDQKAAIKCEATGEEMELLQFDE